MTGVRSRFSTSSLVLIVVSRYSRKKQSPAPSRMPIRAATVMARNFRGLTALVGTLGREMMKMLSSFDPAAMASSISSMRSVTER